MSIEEKKRMDHFHKIDPPCFDCETTIDAQEFLDRCYEIICNLGPMESDVVDFTTFLVKGANQEVVTDL